MHSERPVEGGGKELFQRAVKPEGSPKGLKQGIAVLAESYIRRERERVEKELAFHGAVGIDVNAYFSQMMELFFCTFDD